MKEIKVDDEIYAIKFSLKEIKNGHEWIGDEKKDLQLAIMNYPDGKIFRSHRHVINPREINRTQEGFFIISGRIQIAFFHDETLRPLGNLEAGPMEGIIIYKGGHLVEVWDFLGLEFKAGNFNGVNNDKEFLDV